MRVPSLLVFLLLAAPSLAQRPPSAAPPAPPPKPLDESAALGIGRAYDSADSWSLRAMALLALGTDFPPCGTTLVRKALRDKDERLQPYAVELLWRMDADAVTQIATPELVAELIEHTAHAKNKLVAERTLEVLNHMLPQVGAKDRGEWHKWWTNAQKTYVPVAWVPPPPADPSERNKTGATLFVERAFDLRDAGLDVAIVIDTTSSMQTGIDTARDAVEDVVKMLANLAPKLRLGLVEYKDFEDLGAGAQLLVPLNKGVEAVHERLGRLIASGGGDIPERVEKGIEVALSDDMKWNKEANKLILVIGDAPPHPESQAELLKLVKRAHDEPFARASQPRTGRMAVKDDPIRPFITSTIYTTTNAQKPFEEIAKAGGGSSVLLDLTPAADPAKPLKPGEKPAPGAPAIGGSSPAVRKIVEHIMLLSFGQEHRAQLELFVSIFFDYLDAEK